MTYLKKIWRQHGIGFLLGSTLTPFFIWLIFMRYPFLISPQGRGSYALGQQMGQNLQRSLIKPNSWLFLAGLNDSYRGVSRLNSTEHLKALDDLRRLTLAQTAHQKNNFSEPNPNLHSSTFKNSNFGFNYKIKSPDEHLLKPIQPKINNNQNLEISFQMTILDNRGLEIFNSQKMNKTFRYRIKDLPVELQKALSMITVKQTIELKPQYPFKSNLHFKWPVLIDSNLTIILTRIN